MAGVCLPSGTGTPCAGPDNCSGECVAGFCGCDGLSFERSLEGGALDVYLVLDRTVLSPSGTVTREAWTFDAKGDVVVEESNLNYGKHAVRLEAEYSCLYP